ncbi:uncharacterized protein MAM_07667 [Metarhizium album ARSEF 1941]|uniref:Uncharacterized protein n=1 Tax=Metarhizium album (strain ARSEF 1941) TaxID=1081103 RepID=A0A0B2WLA2_METAS|nr:uncharacterized protein MAM_07667 [Metarhizium album ARSEF 1941]KHN94479.1 hypothetical protein MAM_07667 [Metarhizium album ARSEF 1941]
MQLKNGYVTLLKRGQLIQSAPAYDLHSQIVNTFNLSPARSFQLNPAGTFHPGSKLVKFNSFNQARLKALNLTTRLNSLDLNSSAAILNTAMTLISVLATTFLSIPATTFKPSPPVAFDTGLYPGYSSDSS